MDKEAQNKVELQDEDSHKIKEAAVSKKPKKPSAQSAKKTAEKKSDTSAKKSSGKTSSVKNKTGEKKPAKKTVSSSITQSEEKITGSIKENSKPKQKTEPKKTAAKKPTKKDQPESSVETFEKQSELKADKSAEKIKANKKLQPATSESEKTSEELSVFLKEEKSKKTKSAVKKTSPKSTKKKTQAPADEMPSVQETADVTEDVLSVDDSDTAKKQSRLKDADAKTAEQNEQTITISNEPDVGLNLTGEETELYEQEMSADQAALIAQSAISQELIIQSDTAVLIPPIADEKSAGQANQLKKLLLIYGIIILSVIAVYLGFAQYFKTHFYLGAKINNISIAGLSMDNATLKLNSALESYTLTINERGNSDEQIKSQDISLSYNSLDDLQGYLDAQNGYGWVGAIFSNNNKTIVASFNADMLNQQINNLSCLKAENITEPQNASFSYVDGRYVVVPEIAGNKIDRAILYSSVADSVSIMNTKLDLEQTECYIKPQYTSQSEKTIDTHNMLNTYVSANIKYIFGNQEVIIDASQISAWITIDKNLNISINKNKIINFVNSLENKTKATNYTRDFVTTSGTTVKVSGGSYGKYVSTSKETDFILTTIKSGAAEIRNFNEVGNTYVEISISKQHIWYYKEGVLIADGSIVTGNVRNNTQTRKGVFYLRTKTRNTTLVGADYEADVSYWMPFDGGIGMHDATWRSYFGGSIYRNNGSHGCVNLPYWLARKIYQNISVGTPIVVY